MNNLSFIKYLLLAIFLAAPFFNGLKDPVPLFIFETVIFIIFFIFIKFFTIKKTVLDTPILLFFIFILFSVFTTCYLNSSITVVLMLISFCLLFYITVSIYDENFEKYFYYGFIAVSFLISIIIIIQYFTGGTPKATFPNPNLAAGYIACAATLVFSLLVFNSGDLKSKLIYSALFLFFWVAVALTHSRGGLFSLFCGIAVVFFLKLKKWGIIIFAVGILIIFISLPKKAITHIAKIDGGDAYALKRIEIWKSAISIIKEKPILGTGPGNFDLSFYKHNFPVDPLRPPQADEAGGSVARYAKTTRFAHNEFLQVAAEGGIFTFAIFIFILVVVFKNALATSPVSVAVLSSLIGHSLVDFNLHLPATTIILLFLTAGILYKTRINTNKDKNHELDTNICKKCHSDPERSEGEESILPTVRLRPFRVTLLPLAIVSLFIFNSFNFFYKPFDARKYKESADNLIQEHPEQALKLYQKAMKYSPNDFEYRRLAGELYYIIGNIIKAIENLKKSIQLNPNNPFAVMSLAKIYYDADEFNKAEFYFLKALHSEPNYLSAKYFLARTNEKQEKKESAINEYKNIISINKFFKGVSPPSGYEKTLLSIDMSVVYNSMGFLYMNTGKTQEAIASYNISIDINPSNAEAHSNLASVYYIKKNYRTALSHANLAVYYEKEEPLHLKNLILIYQKLGNKKEIAKLKKKIKNLERESYAEER